MSKYVINGYGVNEVSTAYGVAMRAYLRFEKENYNNPVDEIHIIGGGYTSVFTALLLRQHGHKVKLYDAVQTVNTTIWMPIRADMQNPEIYDLDAKMTYDNYRILMQHKLYFGLKKSSIHLVGMYTNEFIGDNLPLALRLPLQQSNVLIGGKKYKSIEIETIKIEDIFLQELKNECVGLGVTIHKSTPSDVGKYIIEFKESIDKVDTINDVITDNLVLVDQGIIAIEGIDYIKLISGSNNQDIKEKWMQFTQKSKL